MISFPNAKINLGLNIIGKRVDGYHDIETVFYPVKWFDILEFVPTTSVSTQFFLSGLPVAGDASSNLVIKAFDILKKDFNLPELDIYLRKQIPMGAGLGGGSADAAFMISMLNDCFKLEIPVQEQLVYASRLGADCAFFIHNRPMAAHGIGNEFSEISIDLSGYHILLVKPEIHISTAEAYASCHKGQWNVGLDRVIKMPVSEWKDYLYNDFEISVFRQYPVIRNIKTLLYESGAVYAAMSGSGSTVFGIFDSQIDKDMFASDLRPVCKDTPFVLHTTDLDLQTFD